jgi:hypothetical protein
MEILAILHPIQQTPLLVQPNCATSSPNTSSKQVTTLCSILLSIQFIGYTLRSCLISTTEKGPLVMHREEVHQAITMMLDRSFNFNFMILIRSLPFEQVWLPMVTCKNILVSSKFANMTNSDQTSIMLKEAVFNFPRIKSKLPR